MIEANLYNWQKARTCSSIAGVLSIYLTMDITANSKMTAIRYTDINKRRKGPQHFSHLQDNLVCIPMEDGIMIDENELSVFLDKKH